MAIPAIVADNKPTPASYLSALASAPPSRLGALVAILRLFRGLEFWVSDLYNRYSQSLLPTVFYG